MNTGKKLNICYHIDIFLIFVSTDAKLISKNET